MNTPIALTEGRMFRGFSEEQFRAANTSERHRTADRLAIGILVMMILALPGCAMKVEEPQTPPPTNYRQIVAEHIRKSFFDPYSIRDASIAAPRPGWAFASRMGGYKTGWAVCARANAKNRMGAYAGIKETIYVIQEGQVVASGQDLDSADARSGCEGAQYERFPEIEEAVRRR
jgi:hypothetical protein